MSKTPTIYRVLFDALERVWYWRRNEERLPVGIKYQHDAIHGAVAAAQANPPSEVRVYFPVTKDREDEGKQGTGAATLLASP